MVLMATNVGSVAGTITRVVGSVAPVDFLLVFDRLNEEVSALERAAARVWLFADARTVALTNAVVVAAADIITVHHAPASGRVRNLARVALIGRHAVDVEGIASSRRRLANAREALITQTREALELPAADPFQVGSS
jgi:pyridoxine 5'-phosphate synthase PdxJ